MFPIVLTLALGPVGGIDSSRGETLPTATPGTSPVHQPPNSSTGHARITAPTRTIAATASPAPDRQAELAALPRGSDRWWALHDAIEAEADARLAKRLIICNGCFDEEEVTGTTR
jgi:hypothetical protein